MRELLVLAIVDDIKWYSTHSRRPGSKLSSSRRPPWFNSISIIFHTIRQHMCWVRMSALHAVAHCRHAESIEEVPVYSASQDKKG